MTAHACTDSHRRIYRGGAEGEEKGFLEKTLYAFCASALKLYFDLSLRRLAFPIDHNP